LYTFWVSNNILEGWSELPDVTIEQLSCSKLFKYYFTGNLHSKVNTFFPFPGNENHLLKCQILRIMHSTNIVPDGYLEIKIVDNSQEVFGVDLTDKLTQCKEDFIMPTTLDELLNIERWVHQYAYIFDNGKIIESNSEIPGFPRLSSISLDPGI